jgi:hypothetical protein
MAWASEVRSLRLTVGPLTPPYTDMLPADEFRSGSLVLVKAYVDWPNKNGGMWLNPPALPDPGSVGRSRKEAGSGKNSCF